MLIESCINSLGDADHLYRIKYNTHCTNLGSKKGLGSTVVKDTDDGPGVPGSNPVSDTKIFSDKKISTPSPLTW